MNKLLFLVGGAALGIALYKVFAEGDLAPANGLDRAAARSGAWGTGQRVGGAGSKVVGMVKQGAGDLTGNPELSGEGALDQAVGTVKDAAGKAAQAVGSTLHDLNQ